MKDIHPKEDFQAYILDRLDRFESLLQKSRTFKDNKEWTDERFTRVNGLYNEGAKNNTDITDTLIKDLHNISGASQFSHDENSITVLASNKNQAGLALDFLNSSPYIKETYVG